MWSFSSIRMQSAARPCQGHHGGGEYLCPTYCLCRSPGCCNKGLFRGEDCQSPQAELSLQEGRRAPPPSPLLQREQSHTPTLTASARGDRISTRHADFTSTCAQRQGTNVPQKLAQSSARGHVDHPVREFCALSPFFDFQSNTLTTRIVVMIVLYNTSL